MLGTWPAFLFVFWDACSLCCSAKQCRLFFLLMIVKFLDFGSRNSIAGNNSLKYSNFGGTSCRFGGYASVENCSHSRTHVAVTIVLFSLCVMHRVRKSVEHSAFMSARFTPPCVFLSCNVDVGTLNIFPFHMYHSIAFVTCGAYSVLKGVTCAQCHIIDNRYVCMTSILQTLIYTSCADRFSFTLLMIGSQLPFVILFIIFAYLIPRILILLA
jgi:hypothetical protein